MKKPHLHRIGELVQVWNNWYQNEAVVFPIRHEEFTHESGEFVTGIVAMLPNGTELSLIESRGMIEEDIELHKEIARHRLVADLCVHGINNLTTSAYFIQRLYEGPGADVKATIENRIRTDITEILAAEKSLDTKIDELKILFFKLYNPLS